MEIYKLKTQYFSLVLYRYNQHFTSPRFDLASECSHSVKKYSMSVNRLEYIDIAKGVGIILVIAAHGFSGYASNLIFCFHMPLFFLISGILFKPMPSLDYMQKKALHLLLPYAVFLLFFVMIAPSSHFETILDQANYAHPYLVILFGGQHLVSYAMVFWFVTCLFLTQQIFNWLANHLSPPYVIAVAAVFYILSLLDAAYLHVPWPWGVNICLASIPFFTIGYYARHFFHNGRWVILASMIFLACTWAVSRYGYAVTYNMKYTYYGFPVFSAMFALAGSKLVLEFSSALVKYPTLARPLKACGMASIVIMFLGQWIMYIIGDTRFWEYHTLQVTAGIIIPLGIYQIANRFQISRAILLGSRRDISSLHHRLRSRK